MVLDRVAVVLAHVIVYLLVVAALLMIIEVAAPPIMYVPITSTVAVVAVQSGAGTTALIVDADGHDLVGVSIPVRAIWTATAALVVIALLLSQMATMRPRR